MSSRFPTRIAAAAACALALAASGCDKRDKMAAAHAGGELVPIPATALIPGGGSRPALGDLRARAYYGNAAAVTNGMRLFKAYNCAGCHFNGGGGMGPALMDNDWIYGGRLDQIFDSIYQGRPNGMPAWGGRIVDDQIWQIAAYVRSMSLPQTLAQNDGGTPSQHPAPVPVEADMHNGWSLPANYVGKK